MDILTNLLDYAVPTIRAGLPNIACGMLCIIFGLLFFANKNINIKDKLLYGLFFIIIL